MEMFSFSQHRVIKTVECFCSFFLRFKHKSKVPTNNFLIIVNGFHFNSGLFPSVIVVEGFFVNIIKSKIITLVDLRNKSKGNFDLATILSVQRM